LQNKMKTDHDYLSFDENAKEYIR